MADSARYVGSTPVKNPLLSAAGNSFPFENFTCTAQLVPISKRVSSIPLTEDVGEADSFLGQDEVPSLPLPGVQPSALKTPSPEQLQPITFFNALGQPTGGGGLDFLAPAGANTKSIDSSTQSRYKQLVNKRRPLSASLGVIPSRSLIVPPASSSTDLLPPTSCESSTTVDSPLLQEPSISSLLSLLTPKSSSTPTTPKTEVINSSSGNHDSKSQSIPSTLKSSPVHAQTTLHVNPVSLKPESASSDVQPLDQTSTTDTGTLGLSLVQRLLNITAETLSPSPQKQVTTPKPEVSETYLTSNVSRQSDSLVSEAKIVGSYLDQNVPEVSEATCSDGNSQSTKPEVLGAKIFDDYKAHLESQFPNSKISNESKSENSNSIVHTTEADDIDSVKSNVEFTTTEIGSGDVSALGTGSISSDKSSKISDENKSHLERNSNQPHSYRYSETVEKNITLSEGTNSEQLSSQQSSLPGGISAGLYDDFQSPLSAEKYPSQSGAENLNPNDQTSRSIGKEGGPSENEVKNSIEVENLISTAEIKSHVVTESTENQAKSYSTISQQPIISTSVTQNSNVDVTSYQNLDFSNGTSQEGDRYVRNQLSHQDGTLAGNSTVPTPPTTSSANFQTDSALNDAQKNSSQQPLLPPESHEPALNPPIPTNISGTQSSSNPYRVRSGRQPATSSLQYSNSPLYNPQQFFNPAAQNSVSNSYPPPSSKESDSGTSHSSASNSQPPFFSPSYQQSTFQTHPSPTPPTDPLPTPPPAKQIIGIPQSSPNIYSIHNQPQSDQSKPFLVNYPPPVFSSPQPPTNQPPFYLPSTPPLNPPSAPPSVTQQSATSQPSFNRYSLHAKPPSHGGLSTSQLPPNVGKFPPSFPPSSQSVSFFTQPPPTPPLNPNPTPPPTQETISQPYNKYSIHSKPPIKDVVNASKFPASLSHPPLVSSVQQSSIPTHVSSPLPLIPLQTPPPPNQLVSQTAFQQLPPRRNSTSSTSSQIDSLDTSKIPSNTAFNAIPQGPASVFILPPQQPAQTSPTNPVFAVISPHPPTAQETSNPPSSNRQSTPAAQPPFFSPNLQPSSQTTGPPATPPSTPVVGPPPLAQEVETSQTSGNRYSINARPARLRNPYRVFSPSTPQSSSAINHPLPSSALSPNFVTPVTSDSFSSVPLNSDTKFGVSNNVSLDPNKNQIPPLPTSSPLVPTSVIPQQIQENNQKSFPNQGAVFPPTHPPPLSSNTSTESNPTGASSSFSVEKPDQIPPSVGIPLTNNSPASGTLILPQSSQGSSFVHLNAATPPNTVPTISSSLHPPSGIPLGSAQGYRLGKQKPKYAQVPDLVVSPSSPLYSPLVQNSNEPAAPSPVFSPYQAQECFVPSENFSFPNSEFSSPLYANLAQQGGNVASAVGGYQPVYCHWFFRKEIESKPVWKPFSIIDSAALEEAFNSSETNANTIIPTDGGRYDVHILQRERVAVYWEEKKPTEVRRCSWFYKGALDSRYTPYEEVYASQLEEEYKLGVQSNKWNRKVELNGESVVMHGPVVMVHYAQSPTSDQVGVVTDTSPVKPRVVKRGVDEFEFEEGETSKVDHLLFLVHGIGSVCDLKFRDVVETVDDFRSLALQLTRSHFSACVESGQANRVEVLPVSWHGKLHGEDTGIDKKLQSITLKSIPRLRYFTNDTLLDILFYTSPVYCQTIMDTVGNEMNRMYDLFLKRNPDFKGTVCLGGHSLGSLILFDLLYHQKPPKNVPRSPAIVMTVPGARSPTIPEPKSEKNDEEGEEEDDIVDDEAMALSFARLQGHNRRASRINYMMGPAGTGQPFISYPQLKFKPESFFALGSPIGMFVTVRGIETLGSSFRLPTCPGFFNIFHPFDPVAYRIESLIDPEIASNLRPVVIPHHKGRKRMHLELKETMQRVGSDLKNKLVDSVKNTWNTMTQYTMFSRPPEPSPPQPSIEQQVTKALEAHLGPAQVSPPSESDSECGDQPTDITLGCLNGGRRVDYVLQEAPLESFNEYLFALQSHVCYWESEDTMLMILTEVYRNSGVSPDSVLLGLEISRDRSPIKLLSDQFLPAPSPPKSQLLSSLRFPSSASLSSDGTGEGVSRSQSIPKLDKESSPTLLSTSSPPDLQLQGGLPAMGMDPTAPMGEARNLAPPPTMGFVKQTLQRK